MKVGFWSVQIDIEKAFKDRGCETVPLDWHKGDWHSDFLQADCDAYAWYPHALHKQWFKLPDRAGFIELFMKKIAFPSFSTSYLFQNKLHQEYVFEQLKIPRPKTRVITSKQELETYFENPLSLPVVAKDMWNYGGHGIELIKNTKDLQRHVDKKIIPKDPEKAVHKHYVYLQEFIDLQEEYRVMTVGQKIILSYRKQSDQFLGHVWRGAEVDFKVSKDVLDFVKKYNKILQLDCCGWDLARDKKGELKIIELNPIAGTKILEEQGISLADEIASYILKV